jgi:hypothetical protein
LRLAAPGNPWSFFRRSFRLPAHEAWHELAHELAPKCPRQPTVIRVHKEKTFRSTT